MTPYTTPVTDDLAQNVQTIIDLMKRPGSQFTNAEVIDHLQAILPAPPKSLADELRAWAGSTPDVADRWEDFNDLVLRAEEIEEDNRRLINEEERRQAWNQKITDENARLTRERDEARDMARYGVDGKTAAEWMDAYQRAAQEAEQLRGESPADSTDVVIGWLHDYRAELQNGYDGSWEPVQEDEDGGWSNRAVAEERIKHWQGDFPFKVGARICTRAITATTTVREEHRDD